MEESEDRAEKIDGLILECHELLEGFQYEICIEAAKIIMRETGMPGLQSSWQNLDDSDIIEAIIAEVQQGIHNHTGVVHENKGCHTAS